MINSSKSENPFSPKTAERQPLMEITLSKTKSKPDPNELFENDLSVIRQDLNGSTNTSKLC